MALASACVCAAPAVASHPYRANRRNQLFRFFPILVAGPAHPTGLHLESFRTRDGLESYCAVPETFQVICQFIYLYFVTANYSRRLMNTATDKQSMLALPVTLALLSRPSGGLAKVTCA